MEFIRSRIESQVINLTGLSLGQLDLENPKSDPGLFGPDSVCWRVHGDFTSMLIGGIAALMLQALHPLALAGVWDHSNFRQDMLAAPHRTVFVGHHLRLYPRRRMADRQGAHHSPASGGDSA
jgi:uncharacterized protein (DUF2236 family)